MVALGDDGWQLLWRLRWRERRRLARTFAGFADRLLRKRCHSARVQCQPASQPVPFSNEIVPAFLAPLGSWGKATNPHQTGPISRPNQPQRYLQSKLLTAAIGFSEDFDMGLSLSDLHRPFRDQRANDKLSQALLHPMPAFIGNFHRSFVRRVCPHKAKVALRRFGRVGFIRNEVREDEATSRCSKTRQIFCVLGF